MTIMNNTLKELNALDKLYLVMKTVDDIAQDEFGMDYDELDEKDQEWVDDYEDRPDYEDDDHYERNQER